MMSEGLLLGEHAGCASAEPAGAKMSPPLHTRGGAAGSRRRPGSTLQQQPPEVEWERVFSEDVADFVDYTFQRTYRQLVLQGKVGDSTSFAATYAHAIGLGSSDPLRERQVALTAEAAQPLQEAPTARAAPEAAARPQAAMNIQEASSVVKSIVMLSADGPHRAKGGATAASSSHHNKLALLQKRPRSASLDKIRQLASKRHTWASLFMLRNIRRAKILPGLLAIRRLLLPRRAVQP